MLRETERRPREAQGPELRSAQGLSSATSQWLASVRHEHRFTSGNRQQQATAATAAAAARSKGAGDASLTGEALPHLRLQRLEHRIGQRVPGAGLAAGAAGHRGCCDPIWGIADGHGHAGGGREVARRRVPATPRRTLSQALRQTEEQGWRHQTRQSKKKTLPAGPVTCTASAWWAETRCSSLQASSGTVSDRCERGICR